ncbi:hypothetical protein [Pseudomonas shahriarae]
MSCQWKLVPVEPTETMVIHGFESAPDECFSDEEVWEQYQEMSGCQQAAFRAKLCWAAMLAAAPAPDTHIAAPEESAGMDFGIDGRSVRVSQEAYSIFLAREASGREKIAALQQRLTAADDRLDQAVTALNEIARVSRMGEKPFEIATLAIGEMSVLKTADGGDEHDATKDLACYFGLTYARWLTLPRVLMEAMPEEWKRSIANLLNQYDDAYPNQPSYGTTVRVTVDGKIVRTPEWLINYRHPDRAMINQVRGLAG